LRAAQRGARNMTYVHTSPSSRSATNSRSAPKVGNNE
jgi:hypothetical protein